MNKLVKMITDDDGHKSDSPYWHYVTIDDGAQRTLCTGEVFGFGESIATFKTKETTRGGITCPDCIAFIKKIKSIKL